MVNPQRGPLTRPDVLRGLRISVWEGIWATVFSVLTTGAFQTGFALYLGASSFVLGLIAALPAAANLLQLPASLYIERRGERRTFVAFNAAPGRWLWALVLLIPFVLPRGAQVPAFLALVTLSAALLAISSPAWTSWMSDLVPPTIRGQYFGRRNTLASLVTMLVPLPAGAFLDLAVKYHRFDPRIGFAVLFGVGCLAASVSFVLILRQPEPPMSDHGEAVTRSGTRAARVGTLAPAAQARKERGAVALATLIDPIVADANFRRFLIFCGATAFAQTVAAQYFTAWQIERTGLALPYLTVQILGGVAAGAGLMAIPLWGLLGDKFGSRPVLVLSSTCVVLPPFLWLFTMPTAQALWMNAGVIVLLNILSGPGWAGIGLAQFNLLLGLAPPGRQGTYSAVFAAVVGLMSAVAPLIGGAVMVALTHAAVPIGDGIVLNNYKLLFFITGILRIVTLLLLGGVAETDSRSARYVLGQLAGGARRPVTSFVQMRRLGGPTSEADRIAAVDALAALRSPLVVEELSRALDDVSQEVREHAVRALAEIRDGRAVPALVAKLADPAADIGEMAADALGAIGDWSATPFLVAVTGGPDASVRVAALRALARLADPSAAPALLLALVPAQPSTCEAAATALAAIAPDLDPATADAAILRLAPLLATPHERGTRLTAARALRAFAPRASCPRDAFDAVRLRIAEEGDGAVLAQEAGALVRAGRAAGVPASEMAFLLLPLLHDAAVHGLAKAQVLEAVAQVGLGEGVLYPYMGLTDLAREDATLRFLEELRRRVTADDREGAAAAAAPLVVEAIEAHTCGDYALCVTRLGDLVALPPHGSGNDGALAVIDGLRDRATTGRDVTADEALLSVLLARRLIGLP
jgi:HEAT repeat protein